MIERPSRGTGPITRIQPVHQQTLAQRFAERLASAEARLRKERKQVAAIRREARAAGLDLVMFDLARRIGRLEAEARLRRLSAFDAYRDQLSLDLDNEPQAESA